MKAILSVIAGLALLSAAPGAHAQAAPTCSIQGTALMPKDLSIHDAAQGGQPIARFSGGESALTVTEFPTGSSGRARVETGTGNGSFRISGWVDATQIPVFTARQVPIHPGHLWIGKNQKVSVLGATGSSLKVKKKLTTPIQQSFSATAPCSFFTLEERTPPGWSVPGHARGYVVKKDQLELYDEGRSGSSLITVLNRAPSSNGILLWSTERRGGWVRVEHHGAIVLDAWARSRDLKALPPGETMDQLKGPVSKRNPPRLALAEQPKLVTTTREIELRDAAGDKAKVIGKIERTTETYVLDIVAGWASVLPKSLHVAPVGEQQFWVKASELGL